MRTLFIVVFAVFLNACASISQSKKPDPIVILVGVDGLRWDAIDRFPAPAMSQLAREGVRAESLTPVMPSVTFVNFYALATGLYAENTGITANLPYSQKFGEAMDRTMHNQGRWWGGEPIWVTAEKQGVRSAAMFWLGSEAEIKNTRPTHWMKYDHYKPNGDRVDQVLSWLALPEAERPRLLTLYFSDVDSAGHRYGPESAEEGNAITEVDGRIADLRAGVARLGLEDYVNIIIVSDHGMTAVGKDNLVYLDDYINLEDVFVVQFDTEAGASMSEYLHIDVKNGDVDGIYNQLKDRNPHMRAFKRADIPADWHLNNDDRTGQIFVTAESGWLLWGRKLKSRYPNPPKGMHGYDRFDPDIQATFIAAGPNIRHKTNVGPMENVELYGIIARILGLTPAKTDGDITRVEHFLKP